MIRRNTWIAIGIFAAVVIIALILNQNLETGSTPEPISAPQPLWTVSAVDIVGITVEDLIAGAVLEVERHEEHLWRMTRPEQGPTDIARVERAVSWLSAPSPRAQLFDVGDLSDFGLDAPDYRVELILANGSQLEFSVGRKAPTDGSRYVTSPGVEGVLIMSTLGLNEVLDLFSIAGSPTALPAAGP